MSSFQELQYPGRDMEAMSFAMNYHQWVLGLLRPYLLGRCAEVGAGAGNFTQLLIEAGIKELVCFEPSSNLFHTLQTRFEHTPGVTTIGAYLEHGRDLYRNQFDTALYLNVLEHIADDGRELRIARDTLKPGGRLLIFVPALSFLFGANDRNVGHYRRYERSGLVRLVSEAGFEILRVSYFDLLGILPWYITYVLLGRTVSSGNVALYDQWVVPVMRRIEAILPPPIGKNLILIARKPDA